MNDIYRIRRGPGSTTRRGPGSTTRRGPERPVPRGQNVFFRTYALIIAAAAFPRCSWIIRDCNERDDRSRAQPHDTPGISLSNGDCRFRSMFSSLMWPRRACDGSVAAHMAEEDDLLTGDDNLHPINNYVQQRDEKLIMFMTYLHLTAEPHIGQVRRQVVAKLATICRRTCRIFLSFAGHDPHPPMRQQMTTQHDPPCQRSSRQQENLCLHFLNP